MLKYIISGLLIPVIVVSIILGIATIAPSSGTSGSNFMNYESAVFTVNNRNETVIIVTYEDINRIILNYANIPGYKYYVEYRKEYPAYYRSTQYLNSIKSMKILLVAVPSQPYIGTMALSWNDASILLSAYNSLKIKEFNSWSDVKVDLSSLKKYVDKGLQVRFVEIVVLYNYVRPVDIISYIGYRFGSYVYKYMDQVVRDALDNDPTAVSLLNAITEEIFRERLLVIKYLIVPSLDIILRDIVVLGVLIGVLIYDYKRNPREYNLLNKFINIFKRRKKSLVE